MSLLREVQRMIRQGYSGHFIRRYLTRQVRYNGDATNRAWAVILLGRFQ